MRKTLGKYEEIVESLMARSEPRRRGEERARIFAEIGRICATELDDPDQGSSPSRRPSARRRPRASYAEEIERLAGSKAHLWNEVLATITEGIKAETLLVHRSQRLLGYAARWYDQKLGRADMGLLAYQQILTTDPANEEAYEGLTTIYRKAQQWPELAHVLVARADASGSSPRARDLRAEAAELFEQKLNDAARAQEIFAKVLGEDPGHVKAGDGMARIAERTGDFRRWWPSSSGAPRRGAGARRPRRCSSVAEVYEDHLEDLAEATRRYEAVLAIEPHDLAGPQGPRPHLQPHRQVPGAAREPRAADRHRGHAPAEDQPLRAHGGAPRRGVPRPRARGRVPGGHARASTAPTTRRSPRCRAITARSAAGRSSTSSTRSTPR